MRAILGGRYAVEPLEEGLLVLDVEKACLLVAYNTLLHGEPTERPIFPVRVRLGNMAPLAKERMLVLARHGLSGKVVGDEAVLETLPFVPWRVPEERWRHVILAMLQEPPLNREAVALAGARAMGSLDPSLASDKTWEGLMARLLGIETPVAPGGGLALRVVPWEEVLP